MLATNDPRFSSGSVLLHSSSVRLGDRDNVVPHFPIPVVRGDSIPGQTHGGGAQDSASETSRCHTWSYGENMSTCISTITLIHRAGSYMYKWMHFTGLVSRLYCV